MRRARRSSLRSSLVALLLGAAAAQAAAPTLGPVSATNIQGVSALLKGTVNPEGLATTYHFEYVDHSRLHRRGCKTATSTRHGSGSGTADPAPRRDLGPAAQHDLPLPPGRDQQLGHHDRARRKPSRPPKASASSAARTASRPSRSPTAAKPATLAGIPPLPARTSSRPQPGRRIRRPARRPLPRRRHARPADRDAARA